VYEVTSVIEKAVAGERFYCVKRLFNFKEMVVPEEQLCRA
jgi:hypothetical protein